MNKKLQSEPKVCVVEEADRFLLAEDFSAAEDLYRKLVDGLTELLGGQHPEVVLALHKLAAAQAAQEKFNEAKSNEERSKLLDTALKTK